MVKSEETRRYIIEKAAPIFNKYGYAGTSMSQLSKAFASVFVSLIEGGLMLARSTGSTSHLSRNTDHIIHLVNTSLRG